jgi:hypothetical protein
MSPWMCNAIGVYAKEVTNHDSKALQARREA